jgi:hypothetical protein
MSITKYVTDEINNIWATRTEIMERDPDDVTTIRMLDDIVESLRVISIRMETDLCNERIERHKRMQAKLDQFAKEEAFS